MIIVENRKDDDLQIFSAETFWYDDTKSTLKVNGITELGNKTKEFRDVKVFMEDRWWGVKLKVYGKNSGDEAWLKC